MARRLDCEPSRHDCYKGADCPVHGFSLCPCFEGLSLDTRINIIQWLRDTADRARSEHGGSAGMTRAAIYESAARLIKTDREPDDT